MFQGEHRGQRSSLPRGWQRWLVNILAGLPLLLCLAAAVMWVRSYVTYDEVKWGSSIPSPPYAMREATFKSARGTVEADYWALRGFSGMDEVSDEDWAEFRANIMHESGWRYSPSNWYSEPSDAWLDVYFLNIATVSQVERCIVLPYWFLLALTAALPGFVGWRRWRASARRRRVGVCAGCGYDLRASPQRCPECGRPVA